MPAIFDHWFHGSPVLTPAGASGTFKYWFHGSPVLANNGQGTQLVSFTCRAFIAHIARLDMQARILQHNSVLLDMRGFILNTTTKTIDMRTRVARQQGWPIPGFTDPAFPTFQPTQLLSRARIRIPDTGSQSLQSRARIFHGATVMLSSLARIVTAQDLSMRAMIVGKRRTISEFSYLVRSPQRAHMSVIFYVPGVYSSQTLGMGARVAGVHRTRFTGYFLVKDTIPTNNGVQVISFSNNVLYQQSMGMRAFIKK